MKIVNIDASIQLARKGRYLNIPQFILSIIKPLEEQSGLCYDPCKRFHPTKTLPIAPIRMFYDKEIGYENVATLVHTIPIYLRDKKPERKDEEGIIDL